MDLKAISLLAVRREELEEESSDVSSCRDEKQTEPVSSEGISDSSDEMDSYQYSLLRNKRKSTELLSKEAKLAQLDAEMFTLTNKIKFRGKHSHKNHEVEEESEDEQEEQGAVRTLITKESIMHCDYKMQEGMLKHIFMQKSKQMKGPKTKFNQECSVMKTNNEFKRFLAKHEAAIKHGLS
jgi:hypothetical protein